MHLLDAARATLPSLSVADSKFSEINGKQVCPALYSLTILPFRTFPSKSTTLPAAGCPTGLRQVVLVPGSRPPLPPTILSPSGSQ